jgi:uncharacterized membrane-anchored protein
MKLALRRRPDTLPGVTGVARLDRRTSRLVGRLNPGDIAVIDHVDLDRVTAESLVAARVRMVINAQPSISGRYPNLGPELLITNGIELLDNVGNEVFAAVREGSMLRVDGDTIYLGEDEVATGTRQDAETVAAQMAEAKEGLSTQLEAFAANTVEYMKRERELVIDGIGVPEVKTKFAGRHALVVVRGFDYKADLKRLKHYIREYRPVLIGVEGGAEALRDAGYKPDLIVGDVEALPDELLLGGAEVVVRATPDGIAPGLARAQDLGIDAVVFPSLGTSEDLALLLADERGAELIVAVGTHTNLIEFLDKGRGGMASNFLTRLRVGAKLVDAKGVSAVYRSRISAGALLLLVLAAFLALGAALAVSDAGRTYLDLMVDKWDRFIEWAQGLFS